MILSSSISISSKAQEVKQINTSASLELKENKSLWRRSTNAAGILLDNPVKYSKFNLKYEHTKGDFKRPQQGRVSNNYSFNTEGGTFLKNFYVWGYFDYSRDAIKSIDFNSSITDPYRGMPFMEADLNTSNWRNQYYDMAFKVASPKYFDKLSFGIEGTYSVSQAAKQRDIRTRNLFYALKIKPGAVYSLSNSHHIGVNFSYYNLKEEVNTTTENTDERPVYYILYGLGTAKELSGTGKDIDYKGDELGGSIQYNYQESGVSFLASGEYYRKSETAVFSFTTPEKFGATKEDKWIVTASAYADGKKYTNIITAKYINSQIDGIQYITQNTSTEGWQILGKNVRSTYAYQDFTLDYSLVSRRDNEYSWRAGLILGYRKINDEYILPSSFKNAENRSITVNGKINIKVSEKLTRRLSIGGSFKYNDNINGAYNYGGNNPEYPVVIGLEQWDLNYLTTNYYQLVGDIQYSQKWKEASPAHVFIKGVFLFQKANDFDFGDRKIAQVSIGACF